MRRLSTPEWLTPLSAGASLALEAADRRKAITVSPGSLAFWFYLLVLVSAAIGWRYGSKAGVIAAVPTLIVGLAAFLHTFAL
jgi:hypothetical protein